MASKDQNHPFTPRSSSGIMRAVPVLKCSSSFGNCKATNFCSKCKKAVCGYCTREIEIKMMLQVLNNWLRPCHLNN
ncbi:hypothetical protein BpHYR1_014413 [Brachionus plicatilis]|uniref:Uncharacterized protein n=1 Tax=Brachionus plicatilis TaxID=10195 RepID=A0A3M7PN65_BRAPC|nr:hypothetical protein BpHYR1_014413 [Brachionus plicatilis]